MRLDISALYSWGLLHWFVDVEVNAILLC